MLLMNTILIWTNLILKSIRRHCFSNAEKTMNNLWWNVWFFHILTQMYEHVHVSFRGSQKTNGIMQSIISLFAHPVSTSQESFQIKSYRLNSSFFFFELLLFNSHFIPWHGYPTVYSSILLWMYTQAVSRFTLLATLEYMTLTMLPYVLVLSFL